MKKEKLYKLYWEEIEEEDKDKNRIASRKSIFNLFESKAISKIKEMMEWAYEKGKEDINWENKLEEDLYI